MTNDFYISGDYVFIKLMCKNEPYWTVIDVDDLDRINKYKLWHIADNGHNKYAYTSINNRIIMLHSLICKRTDKAIQEVDHIANNGLDNRRENLQITTKQQNKLLTSIRRRVGLAFAKKENKWYAQIRINNKIYIKGFITKEEAENFRILLHLLAIDTYLNGIMIGELDDELAIAGSIKQKIIGLTFDNIITPFPREKRNFRDNIFYRKGWSRWIVNQRIGKKRIWKTCSSKQEAIDFADKLQAEVENSAF